MRIVLTHLGNTITAAPLAKREKLPHIIRLEVVGKDTIAVTASGRIPIGPIPEGFRVERMNKYNEILFINPAMKPHKRKINPILKKAIDERNSNSIF